MNKKYLGLVLGSMLLTLIALIFVVSSGAYIVQGSTFPGAEYSATTTDSTLSTTSCMPLLTQRKTLGSVVVTLTSNAGLYIYDATTTASHSDHATTSIIEFPSTTVGTYTLDVTAKRGICIVSNGSVGVASTTITFR